MKKNNIQYVVKVLSGMNAGASAALHNASGLVIGGTDQCDIIFNGASVADRHVAIELDNRRIRLTPLAQPVYVDGKDIGLHVTSIKANQLLRIGDVSFTVTTRNSSISSVQDLLDRHKRLNSGAGSNTKPPSGSLLTSPWLWLGVAVLILGNIQYFTQDTGGLAAMFGFKETVSSKVNSLIASNKYPDVRVDKNKDGIIWIQGYVKNNAERELLDKELSSFGNNVVLRVFVDTELEEQAQSVATTLGEDGIKFSTMAHGRIKATGITANRSKWLHIKDTIRQDIDGINAISDEGVRNLYEQFLVLKRSVEKEKFYPRISLEHKKGVILIKGRLTESEIKRWVQLKDEFNAASFYSFRYNELLIRPDIGIKLALRSVSVGAVPYVISQKGNKYFKGSDVGKGYFIEAIKQDHILLKNNNIIFPIYFGQNKGK
ncbi:MAG: hypothetical protein KAH22_01815 [Thiotrichaceae bacterium]|nr:hypothetical protein [Thiotrichaceae bacterium]